jgi:hypothetical protein
VAIRIGGVLNLMANQNAIPQSKWYDISWKPNIVGFPKTDLKKNSGAPVSTGTKTPPPTTNDSIAIALPLFLNHLKFANVWSHRTDLRIRNFVIAQIQDE